MFCQHVIGLERSIPDRVKCVIGLGLVSPHLGSVACCQSCQFPGFVSPHHYQRCCMQHATLMMQRSVTFTGSVTYLSSMAMEHQGCLIAQRNAVRHLRCVMDPQFMSPFIHKSLYFTFQDVPFWRITEPLDSAFLDSFYCAFLFVSMVALTPIRETGLAIANIARKI